jgi:DNA-binding CsgD family transcriptional regulator
MRRRDKKLTPVYSEFLENRNREILQLRKRGKSLKHLADRFNLSIRQISRIIDEMSKNA